jgi:hypothetical protein
VTSTGPPLPLSPTAIAHDKWLTRFRTILVGILGFAVAGIGSLAFYTSFEAIKAYAERSGGISPRHAWAVPLLVDSFIVVATGADLWFTTTKQTRRVWEIWWPKALLAGAAGVSFILNVAHAESGNWAARGVAAIPPAALILGVELLMMVLRRATTLRAARLQAELDKQLELSALESPPVRAELTRKQRRPRREIPVPAAAAAEPPAEAERRQEAERDPSMPIFTPTTPARGEDRRPAAAAATRPAGAGAVTRPLRTDKRPGALDRNGKPMTPYVVTARILDERRTTGR